MYASQLICYLALYNTYHVQHLVHTDTPDLCYPPFLAQLPTLSCVALLQENSARRYLLQLGALLCCFCRLISHSES
jgi:hypothetical protein